MATPRSTRRASRGITLVEALVALLVMSIGLLAFAGIHSRLRLNSDVSRQRAEAVRKVQEDIENMRAYTAIAGYTGISATQAARAASGTISGRTTGSNTTFSSSSNVATAFDREIGVFEAGDDRMKTLRVGVTWVDRLGASHSASMRSVIAKSDPKLAARLSLAPNGSPTKDPLGRDAQIPVPAKKLNDQVSVYKPAQSGSVAFVFNNDTGEIVRKCTGVATTTTTAAITEDLVADGATGCTNVNGLILAGYVRFDTTNNPSGNNANEAPLGAVTVSIALDGTTVTTGAPFGTLGRLNSSYWSPTPPSDTGYPARDASDCGAEDSRTYRYTRTGLNIVQTNNGQTTTTTTMVLTIVVPAGTPVIAAGIAPFVGISSANITDVADLQERFIAYTCVVYPKDLNGVQAWTGRSTITVAGQTISSTGATNIKICRYSADANRDGSIWLPTSVSGTPITPSSNPNTVMTKIDNAEHPNAYIRVTTGLTNQNFLVIKANQTCPTDGNVEIDGDGSENYTNSTTVLHQP